MALFIINWVAVSFLWLLVISDSDCLEGQDFIDLSQFDYSVKEILDGIPITFVNNPKFQFEMECLNCEEEDSIRVHCMENELVETIMHMKQKGFQISFPFNISCNTMSFGTNTFMISDIDIRPGITDISMSWTPPTKDIYHYLVIVMDSSRVYTKRILRETSYQVNNLKEKSWHQICIAPINKMWRTGRFKCKKALTYFSTTGPVTNVMAISECDSVFISWSRPEYKYNIPQGYIIYLQWRTNQTCRLYIIKRQPDIDPVTQYSCVNTETITSSLSSLEIKDLPPNSEFTIEISPFNRNKKFAIKRLTIKTKKINSKSIRTRKILHTGCFTDCYKEGQIYLGIRSAITGTKVCKDWTGTRYVSSRRVRSNICSSVEAIKPWCYYAGIWSHCNIPKCSKILSGTGCVGNIIIYEDNHSLTIIWTALPNTFKSIGYLVLLHNSDHFCEQAIIQLCDTCGNRNMLKNQIQNLFVSCKSIIEEHSMKSEAYFKDLHQNRNYNVYIAPILSTSSVGKISNSTIKTLLAKPHIPNGVTYQLDAFHNIKFSWEKNLETQFIGPSEIFETYIINKENKTKIKRMVNTETVTFSNLEMCTEYCFGLSALNEAGDSGYSKELCVFTLAPKPVRSELEDPPSGYMTSQSLNWIYLGTDNCRKTYFVLYGVKFFCQKFTHVMISSNTSGVLIDLKPNVIYTVKVRARADMRVNGEIFGEFSVSKEFYTGTLQPTLSSYQQNLDQTNKVLYISWGIEEKLQESIFMYIIQVKNITKDCMYSVRLDCRACREPWRLKNLNDQHNETLKNLMVCTNSLDKTFGANQISFSYSLRGENVFTSFSVDIYGIDLMGIHLLKLKSNFSVTPGTLITSWRNK